MKVLAVTKHHKKENWRNVVLQDPVDGNVTAICFGAQADQLVVGEPLPEGWKVEPGQYGPVVRYPQREGGGRGAAPAWRNTEEGFRFEQTKMDRRTALMQAVASGVVPGDMIAMADTMYAWLKKES